MNALACTWYSGISEDYIPIVFWKAATMIGSLKVVNKNIYLRRILYGKPFF